MVWRGGGIDSITPTLIDANGQVVRLQSLGITALPVVTSHNGGVEPEAWHLSGSVIACYSLNRVKSCLRITY